MVILANPSGNEIKTLKFKKLDVDLNDTRDFDLAILTSDWDDAMQYGARVFVPGTEFGGVIGKKENRHRRKRDRAERLLLARSFEQQSDRTACGARL